MRARLALLSLVAVVGCSSKPAATPPPSPAAGDSSAVDVVVDCNGKHSLGGFCMNQGERLAWPPSGAGCEHMIGCCEAVSKDPDLAVACLFSALAYERDCAEMLRAVNGVAKEQGKDVPPICKGP